MVSKKSEIVFRSFPGCRYVAFAVIVMTTIVPPLFLVYIGYVNGGGIIIISFLVLVALFIFYTTGLPRIRHLYYEVWVLEDEDMLIFRGTFIEKKVAKSSVTEVSKKAIPIVLNLRANVVILDDGSKLPIEIEIRPRNKLRRYLFGD